MRRLLGIFLIWIALGGCVPDDSAEPATSTEPNPVYLPVEISSCFIQVGQIRYVPDPAGTDFWQSPEQTQQLGRGDCEDLCIYLQHLLDRQGVHAEVVFGLKDRYRKNGHAWCEMQWDGVNYVVEPRSGVFFRRDALPKSLYLRADEIDVVAKKVAAYHERTGIWVNSAYRDFLQNTPAAIGDKPKQSISTAGTHRHADH